MHPGVPVDEFPWMAARVPPQIDPSDADRLRIAGLVTLALGFGLVAPLGLALCAVGWIARSWDPMVVGFWLVAGSCPAAIAFSLMAAFMSSRRGLRCPRGAVAGAWLGVAGVVLLVTMVAYAASWISETVA